MSITIHAQSDYPKINSRTTLDQLLIAAMNADKTPVSSVAPPPDPSCPASANRAVARCIQAYTDAMHRAAESGKHSYDANKAARSAYRQALPPLSGHDNIRDFIACIAHGILIEAISGSDGARLLYAAQVAHTALSAPARNASAQPKEPASTPVLEAVS